MFRHKIATFGCLTSHGRLTCGNVGEGGGDGGDQVLRCHTCHNVTKFGHKMSGGRLVGESSAENMGITVSRHAEFSFVWTITGDVWRDCGVHRARLNEI